MLAPNKRLKLSAPVVDRLGEHSACGVVAFRCEPSRSAPQLKRHPLDSAMDGTVHCERHGPQPETFVCQHLVVSLHTRLPVGFYWARDAKEQRPNAWCAECEERVRLTAGEWNGIAGERVGVSLLCAKCYDEVKGLNYGRESQPGAV